MPRRGERDPERERFWRRTIKAWGRSGASIRGFCAEHGLTETAFHAWRRELGKRDSERQGGAGKRSRTKAATRKTRPARPKGPRFVPVRLTASSASIELERNGTTIRLHGEVDAEALARVLHAVSHLSC